MLFRQLSPVDVLIKENDLRIFKVNLLSTLIGYKFANGRAKHLEFAKKEVFLVFTKI